MVEILIPLRWEQRLQDFGAYLALPERQVGNLEGNHSWPLYGLPPLAQNKGLDCDTVPWGLEHKKPLAICLNFNKTGYLEYGVVIVAFIFRLNFPISYFIMRPSHTAKENQPFILIFSGSNLSHFLRMHPNGDPEGIEGVLPTLSVEYLGKRKREWNSLAP